MDKWIKYDMNSYVRWIWTHKLDNYEPNYEYKNEEMNKHIGKFDIGVVSQSISSSGVFFNMYGDSIRAEDFVAQAGKIAEMKTLTCFRRVQFSNYIFY